MGPKIRIGSKEFTLPKSQIARITIGVLLVIGGILGFLPILGFWMIPLGFLVLSIDLPAVRRWRRKMTLKWNGRGKKLEQARLNRENNGIDSPGVHWSFWLIGVLALIWNVMGSINYLAQMNMEVVASMPESYRAIIENRPAWATGAFAIAVFGGALGCLVLLFRKSSAIYLFGISLLGVMATIAYALQIANPIINFIPVWIGTSMSLLVAAFLIWYSKNAKNKGWIN